MLPALGSNWQLLRGIAELWDLLEVELPADFRKFVLIQRARSRGSSEGAQGAAEGEGDEQAEEQREPHSGTKIGVEDDVGDSDGEGKSREVSRRQSDPEDRSEVANASSCQPVVMRIGTGNERKTN